MLTPGFVRILDHIDHYKDLVSYYTDVYDGCNDGVNNVYLNERQIHSVDNRSVTNDNSILINYRNIQPIPIYGVHIDQVAYHI